jgi:hypothetical protein
VRSEPLAASAAHASHTIRSQWLVVLASVIPLALAFSLWLGSIRQFDLNQMTDIGLVSILPLTFILCMIVCTVGFILVLQQRQANELVLFLYLAGLIWFIHGTPQLLYGTLRYSWAWKHVAIVDYIQRHGAVDPAIQYLNIYHNWPGFFTLNTLITELSGLPSALDYAGWAPVFFNLIDLGALLFIYRSFTSDRRLIWLGASFFFLGNWIGQDYFSPQALTYFLYLIVLGICLAWFQDPEMPSRQAFLHFFQPRRFPRRERPTKTISATGQPYQRVGAVLLALMAMVAIASSHQLTPLMLFAALAGLVVLRSCRVRSLPVILAVITVAWIIFLAVGYLHGSLQVILESIRLFFGNLDSNLVNLTVSSAGQVLVAKMDRGLTVLIGALALLGLLRRFRSSHWDLSAVILLITPLPLLVIPYGGEILFRVYFFMLPFLAFFAAGLFFPQPSAGKSFFTSIALILTSILMLVGLGFGYYGKEKINYFPPGEVAAANYIADHAQPGALIYTATLDWPLIIHNYEYFQYESISNFDRDYQHEIIEDPVAAISKEMGNFPSAYLILSNSQKADIYMTGALPPNSLDQIVNALTRSPKFHVVYQNSDAIVLSLASQVGG